MITLSTRTITKIFLTKIAKVLAPLKLGKYFTKKWLFKDVKEMDWYDEIKVNDIKNYFCACGSLV